MPNAAPTPTPTPASSMPTPALAPGRRPKPPFRRVVVFTGR
jgi:hypothetical protein